MRIEKVLREKEAIIVRREVKSIAGADAHLPVTVVGGKKREQGPHVVNQSLKRGWYTSGGDPIQYPSAYSKKGFSNMVYHCDQRAVEVGEEWLKRFAGTKAFVEG